MNVKKNIENSRARFLYLERKAPFDDILLGNDIKKHLEGCHTAVIDVCDNRFGN